MSQIQVGAFVNFQNFHIWETAQKFGCLSKWELDHPGYVTGRVIGTYGPWDHVPNSKFHWDIYCDSTLLIGYLRRDSQLDEEGKYQKFGFRGSGSSQIEPEYISLDVVRNREWQLSILTNDFSGYQGLDPNECVWEREILSLASQLQLTSSRMNQWTSIKTI